MRICYIITRSDTIGGAQIHVRDLAIALRNHGHKVTVLIGQNGVFAQELRTQGIPVISLRYLVRPIQPFTDLKAVMELVKTLEVLRPDLVAAHSSKAGWIARLAAYKLGIPSTFTAHGWAFTEGVQSPLRGLYMLAENVAARIGDRVITVSQYDRELALNLKVVPDSKIVVVHNGIPDIPSSLLARPCHDTAQLVMVARMDVPKDHALLLQALASLRDCPWRLKLIGDGPFREHYEQLVHRLGIAERVMFLGTRKDVPEHLAQADIFVLASKWEGLPLSILEAMRAGLPVIASDVGGVREAVRDGETGFLIPRSDVNILKARLLTLLRNPDLRLQMGQAGREVYEKNFTLDIMIDKTLNIYESVIRDRRRQRSRKSLVRKSRESKQGRRSFR
ncbi:MAG: glycosyltransferase family 4 protein [Firmicutes bacterium]|nr:glycosyltransferase family 4 protein [Bacillota bacterium]